MRLHKFASLFATALIAFAPVHGFAQTPGDSNVSVRDRPRPEYDPLGMRLGGFDLSATLNLDVSSTDNLFAEEVNEKDDIYLDVSPFARLASHWSRHAIGLDAGANFRSHEDFSSEDAETVFIRGFGRLDIGRDTSVTASAGYAQEVEPRTDPDSPVTLDPVEYDRTDAGLTIQHTFNRFRVTGTAARSEYDYDGAQSFRDNDISLLRGRVEAEITPRIGLFVQAETDERDYDNQTALSSEGQTFLVGTSINLTDLMRGELAIGEFERDYDSGFNVNGAAISANLEWYLTRLTTLSFNVRRNSEDVIGGNELTPYVETRYGARVDHELRRNIILTAGAGAGSREYESPVDRDDEFFTADAGVDVQLNRRVALRARYGHEEVRSDGVDRYRDFDVNVVSIGLSLRL